MFRDFFELKEELLAKGEFFTSGTLRLLSYDDLIRAAIGDAGAAACDIELVEEERKIRLNSVSHAVAEQVESRTMLEDVYTRLQNEQTKSLPMWENLSPWAQVYLQVKCLRAHADNPVPRLAALAHKVKYLNPPSTHWSPLWVDAEELIDMAQAGRILTIEDIRAKFRGHFETIPDRLLKPWDRAVCHNRTVAGYTCSAGCFLPTPHES